MKESSFEFMFANFDSQIVIYRQLLEQSQAQLAFLHDLQWPRKKEQLYNIARLRAGLMDEMVELLQESRGYQREMANELGISEFHLSALKPFLQKEDFERIEIQIKEIAGLLHQIKSIDEECAGIIGKSAVFAENAEMGPMRYNNASRAYQQHHKTQ